MAHVRKNSGICQKDFVLVRDSIVGITTRYGLEGPGIESQWWGRDFPHPSRLALGSTQPPVE